MPEGDGRGGNHARGEEMAKPSSEVGPADVLLCRLILLAREGNRQAVREALEKISEAEILIGRAALCVKRGALQSAVRILEREFPERFGEEDHVSRRSGGKAKPGCIVRAPQRHAPGGKAVPVNMPLAELEQLGLPIRLINDLERGLGVVTLGDLLKFQPEHVVAVPNVGQASWIQIREALAKLGLKVREPVVKWHNGKAYADRSVRDGEGGDEPDPDSDE